MKPYVKSGGLRGNGLVYVMIYQYAYETQPTFVSTTQCNIKSFKALISMTCVCRNVSVLLNRGVEVLSLENVIVIFLLC